jgi:hypothetical protein
MPRFLIMHSLKPTYFPYHPTVSLNHRSVNCYRQKTLAEFVRSTAYAVDYTNSF